jgi:plasmid stabilization system protein ParE
MRVVFDDEALDDLRQIFEWISKDSPRAADALIARIFDKAERLAAPELSSSRSPDERSKIRGRFSIRVRCGSE